MQRLKKKLGFAIRMVRLSVSVGLLRVVFQEDKLEKKLQRHIVHSSKSHFPFRRDFSAAISIHA